MFALFGLIILIIKIAILSALYALLSLYIVKYIAIVLKYKILKSTKFKLYFWSITGFIYTILFFVFAFSYWGNKGLGDYARIPIGNGFAIENIDGYTTCFKSEKNGGSGTCLGKFLLKGNCLCAEIEGDKNNFFIFNIRNKEIKKFNTKKDFNEYSLKNSLATDNELKDFSENYSKYWGQWWFWLLP